MLPSECAKVRRLRIHCLSVCLSGAPSVCVCFGFESGVNLLLSSEYETVRLSPCLSVNSPVFVCFQCL